MKTCRTLNGLLTAIQKGEQACLKYTDMAPTGSGYIIYLKSGANLIVSNVTYEQIKYHLVKV